MKTVLDFSCERNDRANIGDSWNLAIESFLNHCKAKNLRHRTIEWYEDVLKNYYLRDFVVPNKIESPRLFRRENVDSYIVHMQKSGIRASTANVRLRAVRAFFNFLYEENYVDSKIRIRLIKVDKTVIKTFSAEQVKKLIEKPQNCESISFAQYRDWVIINFLIGTGVRLATLKDIKVGDVNFVEREIVLNHTKNREQYVIPLSVSLARVLNEYLKIRQGSQQDYLFCNSYGDMLHERTIQDRVKFWCQDRLGENDVHNMRCCCHDFRHTFAVMFIRNGGDLLILQKLMGHKTLDMTRRYVNLLGADIKAKFANCSPLDSVAVTKGSGRRVIRIQR